MSLSGFVLPAVSIGLGALAIKPRRGFFPKGARTISAQITLRELHHDELEITEHPVEQGAAIADHAYKRPAEVIIECAWSNSPSKGTGLIGAAIGIGATLGGPIAGIAAAALPTIRAAQSLLTGNDAGQVKAIYEQLLQLQASREPFDVYTGKRVYKDMLFRSLGVETSARSENSLVLTAALRQVIIVSTRTVSVPINNDAQADPAATTPVEDVGQVQMKDAPNYTPDPSTFSGSLSTLSGCFSDAGAIVGTLPASDLGQIASSAISTLPDVLGSAQSAVESVLQALPSPSEIPLLNSPQQLAVSMNGALTTATSTVSGAISGAQNALTEAMRGLPAILEQARPAISNAIEQLPAVIDKLPSAFGGLTDVLHATQAQIGVVLNDIPKALARAPLPVN